MFYFPNAKSTAWGFYREYCWFLEQVLGCKYMAVKKCFIMISRCNGCPIIGNGSHEPWGSIMRDDEIWYIGIPYEPIHYMEYLEMISDVDSWEVGMNILGVPKLGDRRLRDKLIKFQLNDLNLWQTHTHRHMYPCGSLQHQYHQSQASDASECRETNKQTNKEPTKQTNKQTNSCQTIKIRISIWRILDKSQVNIFSGHELEMVRHHDID